MKPKPKPDLSYASLVVVMYVNGRRGLGADLDKMLLQSVLEDDWNTCCFCCT